MIIHLCNVHTNNGFMHIWPENLAGRGASQVGSCLLAFSEWSTIVPGVLNVWSDSCAGQNKNFMIICLWQLLILKGTFSMITHKFPIVGHSFNDSDRDGGKVENVLKTKENIYDIDGYIDCIRDAKKKNKFEVRRMNKCFVDLTHAIKQLNLIRRTENEDGEKIELRDKVRQIRATAFGSYEYKHSFKETEPWKKVNILKKGKKKCNVTANEWNIPYLPVQNRPLKEAKVENIKELLAFIPPP